MQDKIEILPHQVFVHQDQSTTLYSLRGVSEIHHLGMKTLLERLSFARRGAILSISQFNQVLLESCLEIETAKQFLTHEVCLIRTVPEGYWRFEEIFLIHDCPKSLEILAKEIRERLGVPCHIGSADQKISSRSLTVLFQQDYTPHIIHAVYHKIRAARDAACMTAFIVGRTLVIDGLYVPGAVTPCHFCGMEYRRISGKGQYERDYSWSYLSSILKEENKSSYSEFLFSELDRMLCLSLIRNQIFKFSAPSVSLLTSNDYTEITQFNLDTAACCKENAPLWAACGCLIEKYTRLQSYEAA